MRRLFVLMCLVLLSSCAAQPRIVADPPEHPRLPTEEIPWEEQYERAMIKPGALPDVPPDIHENQDFAGPMSKQEERGTWGVVADVIAFPFRAFGWLIASVF